MVETRQAAHDLDGVGVDIRNGDRPVNDLRAMVHAERRATGGVRLFGAVRVALGGGGAAPAEKVPQSLQHRLTN